MRVNRLKNIKPSSFKINNRNIYINKDEGVIVYDLSGNEVTKIGDKHSVLTIIFNNYIVVGSKENFTSIVYDNEFKKRKMLDYILLCWNGVEKMSTDKYIYAKVRTKDKSYYAKIFKSCLSIDSKLKVDDMGRRFYSILKDDFIFYTEEKKISVYDNKNKPIWLQSYCNLTGVNKNYISNNIEVNSGKLYLRISSSEGRTGLLALDILTGEEITFYDKAYDLIIKDKNYIYTYKYEFCVLKIDSITNEVEEISLKEVLLKNGFDPNTDLRKSTVRDNKIYFTQFMNTPYSKLGVINLDTKEMIYQYDFSEENGAIGNIQVSNDIIHIHTQDNTLHIFESE